MFSLSLWRTVDTGMLLFSHLFTCVLLYIREDNIPQLEDISKFLQGE